MVGAVIVYNDKIIGEGWHRKYGDPHAEVNAIMSVKNHALLSKSTMYVTLEPCSHYGKTPPCSELICKHGIPKVVICNKDPNEKVNGKGIDYLQKNGVEVVIGVLAEKGFHLNRRFFTYHLLKRPYIILKWAETANGFMDIIRDKGPEYYWITNAELKVLSHKLRNEEQAILIGMNTMINDHPQLTNRLFGTHQPYRFVSSRDVLSTKPAPFTIIPDDLNELLKSLYDRKIESVIIEGGKRTLLKFIESGLWDEAFVYEGDQDWENGLKAPSITSFFENSEKNIRNNKIRIYKNTPFLSPFLNHLF
jgi:diaminohydroxyphosphoribosylaminopyrimidine deaminase/5-amino-6-(5-phosphoribosylamino)uracil reductase